MHKKSLRAYLLALMAFCLPIWPSLHLARASWDAGRFAGTQAAYGYEDTSQPHALTRYSDPAGRLQLKAEYDSQGRVIKQTDALGQSVSISHQICLRGAKGGLGRSAALRVLAGSQGPSAVGALPFSLIPALSLLMARL